MMFSKLKLFLAKIHHSKAIPRIIVPFIYLKCTSVEFDTVLIILQGRIPTFPGMRTELKFSEYCLKTWIQKYNYTRSFLHI
jgi:hypothetical protein